MAEIILEDNKVHVLEIDADDKFDGMAAVAHRVGHSNDIKCASVIVKKKVVGERQRLNLTHELGHLVLNVAKKFDEEKIAFRFGAAFLAPREILLKEIGKKRKNISLEEMLLLKRRFGMSLQAMLYRMKDLEIISESYYSQCFRAICKFGWRKQEPESIPLERPERFRQQVLRAVTEQLLSKRDAEKFLGEKVDEEEALSLTKIRSLVKLSLEERRRILREQVNKVHSKYVKDDEED